MAIKPCPFCGNSYPQLLESNDTCWVSCVNIKCEADGPVREDVSAAEAAWNYRPPKMSANNVGQF